MPLTRDVKETIRARIKRDPEFGEELLKEGIECLLAGEVGTGKILLRDYITPPQSPSSGALRECRVARGIS